MSNLAQRAITAILGVSIMVSGIWFSPWSFGFIFLALTLLTLKEFYTLSAKNGYHPFSKWGIFLAAVLFALVFLISMQLLKAEFLWLLPALLTSCFLFPMYASKETHPINCLAISILGIIYIVIPFTLMTVIAFRDGEYAFQIVLGLLVAQWANDTGAYFVGKSLGKRKLFEKVSPNKTWEGAIGGGITTLAVLYGWSHFFEILSLVEWFGLGLIVSVFGSFGDLVESQFKRAFAIKDSGTVLKGHGGFLDRFDGLIIAIPFATAYLMLVT